jgi:hypothetical protein
VDDERVDEIAERLGELREQLGDDDYELIRLSGVDDVLAWGPEKPFHPEISPEASLALAVQFADGNPNPHPDELGRRQFAYGCGLGRLGDVLALTQTRINGIPFDEA